LRGRVLFGFQPIAVFNERFMQLSEGEQLIHFTATLGGAGDRVRFSSSGWRHG
jgi:hypothetical protein